LILRISLSELPKRVFRSWFLELGLGSSRGLKSPVKQRLRSSSGAQSAGNALQEAALRTGQSVSGAVGATEAMQQQNERTLSGQEAASTQQRIAANAAYNQSARSPLYGS
jgi:hypothetical protein